jgi:hypothetical protein
MAGAGYKLFNTGDVLTAAQVNTYLNEQTVMVFANSTARTTALSGVLAEGMVSYLQDTNAVEVYNGSAWVGVSGAGDVTEVQAGTGISVASGTGPIPVVTNTMATAIDAEGDLIIGDAADAFQRLAIGSNTHVLTVDTSVDGKIKWAAPAAGGAYTSIASGSLSSNAVNITSISGSYTDLYLVIKDLSFNTDAQISFRFNNDTGANKHYIYGGTYIVGGVDNKVSAVGTSIALTYNNMDSPDADNQFVLRVNNYSVAQKHSGEVWSVYTATTSAQEFYFGWVGYSDTAAITEINLLTNQTFSGGTYILYGVK